MSDRVYCPTCRNTVAKDYPHSCYDFDAVERLRQCERDVIAKAKAYEFAFRDPSDPWGWEVDAKQDALFAAVRALDAAEGAPGA